MDLLNINAKCYIIVGFYYLRNIQIKENFIAMRIKIKLPDGAEKEFDSPLTPLEVAQKISGNLAQDAIAARVNGVLVDLTRPLTENAELKILTFADEEGQIVYRHSSSHVLAQAVKNLYPAAKLAIGPAISDGFYYDIEFPGEFSAAELEKIEAEMQRIIDADLPIRRKELEREEAIKLFRSLGEDYKVELLQEIAEQYVSVYCQGNFVDLCRGPHVPSTGYIKAFKLLSVAGAYWRGDEHRQMLQRIYGVSFPDKQLLEDYLKRLEEARARDHRRLGKELDLFSFHDEGPGFPFFHANGTIIYNLLIDFMREELRRRGYQEVRTPIILNEELWHRSGHWEHYKENMYFTEIDEVRSAIKPMNCPGGLLTYKTKIHSYREFPLRVAEFGLVHRHELSGVLHGLFRVRVFTQDDAHVFCLPDQLEDEIKSIIDLMFHIYRTFGFEDFRIELSTRPEKSIGTDEMWERATSALQHSLEHLGISYKINPGEGAFYGPKIDFHLLDCLNRSWQCGTIQVDFSMPERFDLTYVGPDGQHHRPVMVHRAILGSVERFMGILIEHYAGNFPLWLAPVQIRVLTITSQQNDYALRINEQLRNEGFRSEGDIRPDKIGYKIRESENQKIPCMLIVGKKEMENNTVALRRHKLGDLGSYSLDKIILALKAEISSRSLTPVSIS